MIALARRETRGSRDADSADSQLAQGGFDLEQMARRHAPYLAALAARALGPQLRAKVSPEDLVQETLLQAHRHAAGLIRWEPRRQRAWLRRVLGNQLKDAHRRHCRAARRSARREVAWRHDVDFAPRERLSETDRVELLDFVEVLFRSLPQGEARVLRMRYWEQQSFVAIGRSLQISPEAARRLWFRGILRLRPRVFASESTEARGATPAGPRLC